MRLHSSIWVAAFLRQVASAGAIAVLTRRGEETAGAIYIKVSLLDGTAQLYSPAPLFDQVRGNDRAWYAEYKDETLPEREIDSFLAGQAAVDQDIWIVEVEDREGRHFLGDQLTSFD